LLILDAIPGRLSNIAQSFIDWVNRIDQILRGLHKIFGVIPDGIAEALSKVVSVFKKTTTDIDLSTNEWEIQIKEATAGMTGSMEQGAAGMQASATKILGGLSAIAGGVLAFAGIPGAGRLGGAISGALGALSIAGGIGALLGKSFAALFTGPAAPFVIGGIAIAGVLGAIFGGGKSELQKAQEAAALQQAKDAIKLSMDQVLKSAQEVIQSAVTSFQQALAFFEQLDEFTPVRKEKFRQFFANLSRMMDYFFELAKQFAGQSLADLKGAAETIAPIAEAIAALPDAFTAIRGHFPVADAAIDAFFVDLDKMMTKFFERADAWIGGQSKRARKVAERLLPVVDLLAGFGEALKSVTDIKDPGEEMFEIMDRVLNSWLHISRTYRFSSTKRC
jgi:hypothetical protein